LSQKLKEYFTSGQKKKQDFTSLIGCYLLPLLSLSPIFIIQNNIAYQQITHIQCIRYIDTKTSHATFPIKFGFSYYQEAKHVVAITITRKWIVLNGSDMTPNL
jgi:hypothetical protein